MRTGGRWGGGDGRSWLLIKHKDDWAGDVDITEFAPRSVKSDGDFEDILAADRPDVWVSNRPAKGGEAGAMLAKIIEKAAALKAGQTPPAKRPECRAESSQESRSGREACAEGSTRTEEGSAQTRQEVQRQSEVTASGVTNAGDGPGRRPSGRETAR